MINTIEQEKVLNRYKSDFLDTAVRLNMKEHVGLITYLDTAEKPVSKKSDYPEIGLNVLTKAVQSESYQIDARYPNGLEKDLKSFGVNPMSEIKATLYNEGRHARERQLYNMYNELGNQSNREWFINNFWKRFLHNTCKIPVISYVTDPVRAFFTISNMIAVRSRRGGANFAIVGKKMLGELQASPSYVYSNDKNSSSLIEYVGHLPNMKIFVNHNLNWDDDTVIFGKSGQETDPGVYYCQHSLDFNSIVMNDSFTSSPETKVRLTERCAIVKIGDTSHNRYMTVTIKNGKKPFWRKLLGI